MAGFYFIFKNQILKRQYFLPWLTLGAALISYFLYEINIITNVHDYYLFPFLPLLFVIVSYGASQMLNLKKKFVTYFVIFCLLILPLSAYLRMATRWNPLSPGFNVDVLNYKKELRDAVPKDALCVVGNDVSHYIYFYYINKKGWGFHDNNLDTEILDGFIAGGAQYLYSDSRAVDENPEIVPMLDSLVLEKESFRVYKLIDK